jgi:carboxypeptidase C (cathepsin A)
VIKSGFSFTSKDECHAKSEEEVASDLYDALQQFFTLFPDLGSIL